MKHQKDSVMQLKVSWSFIKPMTLLDLFVAQEDSALRRKIKILSWGKSVHFPFSGRKMCRTKQWNSGLQKNQNSFPLYCGILFLHKRTLYLFYFGEFLSK